MKYKILKMFSDKNTLETYKIGSEHEFSDERAKEMTDKLGGGYLAPVQEAEAATPKATETPTPSTSTPTDQTAVKTDTAAENSEAVVEDTAPAAEEVK